MEKSVTTQKIPQKKEETRNYLDKPQKMRGYNVPRDKGGDVYKPWWGSPIDYCIPHVCRMIISQPLYQMEISYRNASSNPWNKFNVTIVESDLSDEIIENAISVVAKDLRGILNHYKRNQNNKSWRHQL